MDASEYASSGMDNWLKAEDLKGAVLTLEIEDIEVVTFGLDDVSQHKLGLFFKGKGKGIIANKTNTKKLIAAFGPETDAWKGKQIVARQNDTPLGVGFSLDAAGDFDDDIPF